MSFTRRGFVAATLAALASAPILFFGRRAAGERPRRPEPRRDEPAPSNTESRKKPIWIGHC